MKKSAQNRLFPLVIPYVLLLVLDLICLTFLDKVFFRVFTKLPIVLSLLVYVFCHKNLLLKRNFRLVVLALFFCLLGDLFLIFDDYYKIFFLVGLGSFLIGHVFYIFVFSNEKFNLKKGWQFFLLFTLAYSAFLFFLIKDSLNDLLIPVLLYMAVILVMINTAYLRNVNSAISYNLVLTGALLFMVSDSVLAVNMFYEQFTWAPLVVMTTYAAAQFLIVIGLLKDNDFDQKLNGNSI